MPGRFAGRVEKRSPFPLSPVCEPSVLFFFFLIKMHFYLRKNGSVNYRMSLNLDLSDVVGD